MGESIRGMARKRKYNEIYDLMDSQQDKQLDAERRELNDHFAQYGVVITDISITNVHLPKEFADTMQEATVWHNRNEFKTLQQEYDLRKIEVRESEEKKKNVDAETAKQLSAVREDENADVAEIKSKAELVVAKLNSERDVRLSKIRSGGMAEADKIKIETQTYLQTKKALAEAEAFSAKQLIAKRKYEAKMRSLQSLRALANNNSLAISGNSKDNMLAQLLANQQGGAVLGVNGNF